MKYPKTMLVVFIAAAVANMTCHANFYAMILIAYALGSGAGASFDQIMCDRKQEVESCEQNRGSAS